MLSTSILKTRTMTTLEIILTIILWVNLGLFICHKRDWYKSEGGDQLIACIFSTIFAPINFILTFFKEYLIKEWK